MTCRSHGDLAANAANPAVQALLPSPIPLTPDSQFRLITARRNPNMVILFVALLFGRPDIGLVSMSEVADTLSYIRERVETVIDAVEEETGHVGVTVIEAGARVEVVPSDPSGQISLPSLRVVHLHNAVADQRGYSNANREARTLAKIPASSGVRLAIYPEHRGLFDMLTANGGLQARLGAWARPSAGAALPAPVRALAGGALAATPAVRGSRRSRSVPGPWSPRASTRRNRTRPKPRPRPRRPGSPCCRWNREWWRSAGWRKVSLPCSRFQRCR